jgi:hypothetical protein
VSQNLVAPITIENPPKADGVDESCNLVLQLICGNDEEPQPAKRSKNDSSNKNPKKKRSKTQQLRG